MNAKDLMIGDWVLTNAGHPAKVVKLSDGEIHCEDKFGCVISFEFDPVPLTPEILEKNGFVKKGERARHLIYDLTLNEDTEDESWVVVKLHPKNEDCNYMWATIFYLPTSQINKNTIETKIVDCSVHQLQHALRLCGIKKEIVL